MAKTEQRSGRSGGRCETPKRYPYALQRWMEHKIHTQSEETLHYFLCCIVRRGDSNAVINVTIASCITFNMKN